MKSSRAQRRFKRLAGHVNHFLITILVGLDAVRAGTAQLSPTYSTSWAPHDVVRSADRSGEFAIKALVAWLVDALDAYVRELNRKPFLLQDKEARGELDSLSSVHARVKWLAQHLELDQSPAYGLCVVGIIWRNRLVHSDAENEVPGEITALLEANVEVIRNGYQGLEVRRALESLDKGHTPTLKEVTTLVRAAHNFIGESDERIRKRLKLDTYFKETLEKYVSEDRAARLANVWGKDEKTRLKSLRQIAMQAGLSEGEGAPSLGEETIKRAAGLSVIEARETYAER
jgi:hypothetical protein